MANKKYLVGILAMVLVFGMAAIGCDNGTTAGGGGVIPIEWTGTLHGDDGFSLSLNANGTASWTNWPGHPMGANASLSGHTVTDGGTVSGGGVTGEWVYLRWEGVVQGIMVRWSPAVQGYRRAVGIGNTGFNTVMGIMTNEGATFPNNPQQPGFNNRWAWAFGN